MDSDARRRLNEAKRRHRQARDLPKFRGLISDRTTLGNQFSMLGANESAALEEQAYAKLRELRGKGKLLVVDGLGGAEFDVRAAAALRREQSTLLLVFLCRWSHVGAMLLTGRDLAQNVRALLEVDGDTVTACTRELDRIISFDVVDEGDGTRIFEVAEWHDATVVGTVSDADASQA
jgi:hypothetical protein